MHPEKVRRHEFITLLDGAAGWPLAAYTPAELRRGPLAFLQADDGQVQRVDPVRPNRACKVLTQFS